MAHKGNHTTETFFYRYPRISFKKGTMLIGADENPTGIFFIEKGFVKQYVVSPKGEVLMLTIFRPGAFIPLTWGLNKTINTSTFESLTEVVIYRAPKEDVVSFLKNNPDILFDRTQRLLLEISGLLERMQTIVLDSAYDRVVRVLIYFGKTFGPTLPFPLPHKEIAAWTGLARETVSLQIEKLVRQGKIQYSGRHLLIKKGFV